MAKPIAQDENNFLFETDDGSKKALNKSELSEPTRNRLETFLSKKDEPIQETPLIFRPGMDQATNALPAETETPTVQANTEMTPQPQAQPMPQQPVAQPQEQAPAHAPSVPKTQEVENIANAYDKQANAKQKFANAASKEAQAEAQILDSQNKKLETLEINRQAREKDRADAIQAKMDEYENAVKEYTSSPEKKVDPNRFWSNKSTGEKVQASIGLILGGIGSRMGGHNDENPAIAMLNKQIDTDVESQKSEIASQKDKLKSKITGQKNLLSMMRDKFGDERQAELATRSALLDITKQNILQNAAKYKSDQIQANAQDAIAQLDIQKNKYMQEFNQETQKQIAAQEVAKMKAQAALNNSEAKLKKEGNGNRELSTPFGEARTKDDAKKIKEASETKASFDQKLTELINLRSKQGAEVLNRDAVARGKQLSKELLLQYKNMAKLGVLSESDESIIDAIIPSDPLEMNISTFIPGAEDNTLNRLKALKDSVNSDFNNSLKTRLQDASQVPSGSQQTSTPDINSDVVTLQAPNGETMKVKKSAAQKYIDKGAKIVGG